MLTTYETLNKQQRQGYDKGVSACLNIMQELIDNTYGDDPQAEQMYCDFLNRVRKLKPVTYG